MAISGDIKIEIHTPCKHCEQGEENEYGDIWFLPFNVRPLGTVWHDRPRITKRNGRYFMTVDNFAMFEIKACPICGRKLTKGE